MTAKLVLFFGGLCVLGVAAAWLMLYITPFGIGIWLDSLHYISAAASFVDGLGFGRVSGCGSFKPMTHYPPFYPFTLAAFSALDLSPVRAARVVSALCFGSTVTLSGLLLYKMNRSRLLALLGAGLVMVSAATLKAFSWALSEPLYIPLFMAGFLFLAFYLEQPRRFFLLGVGGLLGLAFLTRYVGVAEVVSAGFVLFLNHRLKMKRRLWDLSVLGVLGVGPVLLWFIRNYRWMGTTADRNLGLHPPGSEVWSTFAGTVLGWFFPKTWTTGQEMTWFIGLGGVCALMLAGGVYWSWRKDKLCWRVSSLELLLVTSILAYLLLLGVSLTFFDPNTALNDRILIPVYVQLIILLVSLVGRAIQSSRVMFQAAEVIGLGLFMVWQVQGARLVIQELRKDGQGYASSFWRGSMIIKELKEMQPSLVYSNDITAVYFLVGVPACSIPVRDDLQALAAMREKLSQAHTVLAIFGRYVSGEFIPYEEVRRGLQTIYDQSDGEILALPGSP